MRRGEKKASARLDREQLWQYALRILSGRGYSISELRDKLRQKAGSADDVEPVLSRLKEYGYLDDRRYSESYAAARLANQGLGKFRVLADLRRRCVAPKVAEAAVEQAYRGADEVALIEEFLRRKYRHTPLAEWLQEPRNLAAAYRRLRHAGFTAGNAIRVLKHYSAEAEQLESLEE